MLEKELENNLKYLLQRDIRLYVNKKCWKKGKFILYKCHDFTIQFIIKNFNNNKISKFDVPIPFKNILTNNIMYFDYTLKALGLDKSRGIKLVNKNKPNILFDNILEIEVLQ